MLLSVLRNLLNIALDSLEILAEDAAYNPTNDEAKHTDYPACQHHLGMVNFFIAKLLIMI